MSVPAAEREAVVHLKVIHEISGRRARRVIGYQRRARSQAGYGHEDAMPAPALTNQLWVLDFGSDQPA